MAAIVRLTNFSPRELALLWGTLRGHVVRYWNVGRGRRSRFAAKDVFFMVLVVLKNGGTWDMLSRVFGIKTPTFIKTVTGYIRVIAPKLYAEWVEKQAEEETMQRLVASGRTFRNNPCVLYATDVTFQQSNRPSGNVEEAMPFYSGKHKLYGLKVEVFVGPRGFAVNWSEHARSNTSGITMFRVNESFHASARIKAASDGQLEVSGPLRNKYPDEWALLADKGYQGLAEQSRCIHPRKGTNLSLEDERINRAIASDLIIIENFFGRLCGLWRICADKYRWGEDLYDDIFQICVSLTNCHVASNPLRDANGYTYNQVQNRLVSIGTESTKKRRLAQKKYHCRKRLRHQMTLDTLPASEDFGGDDDLTQMRVDRS